MKYNYKIAFFLAIIVVCFPFQGAWADMFSGESPYPYTILEDYIQGCNNYSNLLRSRKETQTYIDTWETVCQEENQIRRQATIEKDPDICLQIKPLLDQAFDFGKKYNPTNRETYTSMLDNNIQDCKKLAARTETSFIPPPQGIERYTFLIQILCLLMGAMYFRGYIRREKLPVSSARFFGRYVVFGFLTFFVSAILSYAVVIPVHPLYDILFVKSEFYKRVFTSAIIYTLIVGVFFYTLFQNYFTDKNRKKEFLLFLLVVHPFFFPLGWIIYLFYPKNK